MSIRQTILWTIAALAIVVMQGCEQQFPVEIEAPAVPAAANKKVEAKKPAEGCRISGRIFSSEWRDMKGGIERSIVSASSQPGLKQAGEVNAKGEHFELDLPPGKYQLTCSAVGTRGATFKIETREITIAKDQQTYDLGEIDLPISKSTGLYGKPAPELTGIIAWQNTPALSVKDLRGKVIVLDFFAYYCTICHAHKPDLERLQKKYERQGLVVLAIHDASLKNLDEMNAKMNPILRDVFDGNPPKLPIALDGPGKNSVFDAYGIYAVPAVILIDQQGRVVRRYHHAGVPELEHDVQSLLTVPSGPIQL